MRMLPLSSIVGLVAAVGLVACSGADTSPGESSGSASEAVSEIQHGNPDSDARGVHLTKELHAARHGGGGSPLMTNHGGKIMPVANSTAIFWGPSWSNAAFASDKITGLDTWYSGHVNSRYAATVNEYAGTNGQVTSGGSHAGHVVDLSTASGGGSTATILAEVCKQISAGAITVDKSGNGYYPVYTDVKRGNAGYCAWHSAGSCGGVPVQFAFFWNLDGDSGCDPQDTSGLHSQGLAALASVTGHELAEARSDPASPGAWYDSSGNENGDKCAWTFGAPLVTFANGSQWKIQGEWSNAAYTANTGYPNSSGQHGCLSGL
jgi:hypothetical protein